jgi:uncharacterized protein YcbX
MTIAALHRYPVKGLSPEPLSRVTLQAGAFFPCDRLFAIENGRSSFDEAAPSYQPKTRFLMLMKNARLAQLASRYDEATHVLSISYRGEEMVRGDLRSEAGRAEVERSVAEFCADEMRGPLRLLSAPEGFRFTDSIRAGFVSLLNLASVLDLERRLGRPVNPLRFRANIAVEGWDAWLEEGLVGRRLAIGDVRLKVLKPIDRCPATHVEPHTGERDLDIMATLQSAFGHLHCGIYASVIAGGEIAVGDTLRILD